MNLADTPIHTPSPASARTKTRVLAVVVVMAHEFEGDEEPTKPGEVETLAQVMEDITTSERPTVRMRPVPAHIPTPATPSGAR